MLVLRWNIALSISDKVYYIYIVLSNNIYIYNGWSSGGTSPSASPIRCNIYKYIYIYIMGWSCGGTCLHKGLCACACAGT